MSNVIDIRRRLAWRRLKRMAQSGKIMLPPKPVVDYVAPTSDMTITMAYMLESYARSREPKPRS